MKKRMRTCEGCLSIEETFSKSLVCASCVSEKKKQELIISEKKELAELGYRVIDGPAYDDHNHRKYRVITPCCGVEYEPLILTVRSMLDRRGILPCLACGGKARMAIAMGVYLKAHSKDYDLAAFEDYKAKVRKLSEKSYRDWMCIINPHSLNRGHTENHLDHKVPIIWCFKNNVPPVLAANIFNLQMLKYDVNIRKFDKPPENPFWFIGYDVVNVLDYEKPEMVDGKLNIWPHDENMSALNSMLIYRKGQAQRINARSLKICEIAPGAATSFFNTCHLHGAVHAQIAYGLFDGANIMMALSLGKPRFSKHHDLEVLRMASMEGTIVRGGASKLFAYAKGKHQGKKVVCYSDLYIGKGDVYSAVGFTRDGSTGSGYFWERNGQVLKRYQTQKHKLATLLPLFDETISEMKNMSANGWRRVMTAGSTRWVADW